jgi:hypothetical protein
VNQIAPFAVLAVGWLGLLVYAHPGYMSYDSIEQLRQTRSGTFTDWHPPVMAMLWRLVELVWRGPLGMFVLQSVTFVIGGYLLLRRWLVPVAAAIACLLVTWFPPMSSVLAVIWKDSQMMGYATLGIALLVRGGRRSQLAALAWLALASAMRHNAFTITFAPVVLLFEWRPGVWSRWRRYAVATGAWLVITATAFGANVALTDVHTHPWTDAGQAGDVGGMIACAPPMTDDELREILADTPFTPTKDIQAAISDAYDPEATAMHLWEGRILELVSNDTQRVALDRAWWTLLREYPGAYLEHRARMFVDQLQIGFKRHQNIWVGIDPIGKDLYVDDPTPTQKVLRRLQIRAGASWLFWPWLYLLATLIMVPVAVRRRDRVVVALGLSGISSMLPLFVIAPAAGYRYAVWLVLVTLFAAIALVATAVRARRRHGFG